MTDQELLELAKKVWSAGDTYIGPSISSLSEFAELAIAAEREECAKIAEDQMEEWEDVRPKLAIKECAAAIRERGDK